MRLWLWCSCSPYSHFETLAVAMLTQCYDKDKHKTEQMLMRELPDIKFKDGRPTSLLLLRNKKFISTPACQSVFEQKWKGEIDRSTPKWRVRTYYSLLSPCVPCEAVFSPCPRFVFDSPIDHTLLSPPTTSKDHTSFRSRCSLKLYLHFQLHLKPQLQQQPK